MSAMVRRIILATFSLLGVFAYLYGQVAVPDGFTITTFSARGLRNPTRLAFDGQGRLFVAQLDGTIALVEDTNRDGRADRVHVFASGFDRPTGLTFLENKLYVSSNGRVTIVEDTDGDDRADVYQVIISGLPAGGAHQNNGITFGRDGKMYIGMGSTCNACTERDPRSATILRADPDGTNLEVYARGLRNVYDLAFHPATGELFATDNGRDDLGPDQPPEELNLIVPGGHYGWPGIPPAPVAGSGTIGPIAEFPAHSSANGMTFYNARKFLGYENDLFICYFGNNPDQTFRARKVVRVRLTPDGMGSYRTTVSDFVTGLQNPLDVAVGPDENIYIADFGSSIIYRVSANNPELLHLTIPRFVQSPDLFTGIALVNPTTAITEVTLTLYDDLGNRVQGLDMTNPRVLFLNPGTQRALLGNELFGKGLGRVSGWVDVASSNSELRGFFLSGDRALTFLDGADASSQPARQLIFTDIADGVVNLSGRTAMTEVTLINPNSSAASARLDLYDGEGNLVRSASMTLPPRGRVARFVGELFSVPLSYRGHIIVSSDASIYGFEWIQIGNAAKALNAQRLVSDPAPARLFAPHRASGGGFVTELNIINANDAPATVTRTDYSNEGAVLGAPFAQVVPAHASLHPRWSSVFPDTGLMTGYEKIESDSGGIYGNVTFLNLALDAGPSEAHAFATSLPLIAQGGKDLILSHVAQGTGAGFWTGIVVLNPANEAVDVRLEIYNERNQKTGETLLPIAARQKLARLIEEFVPTVVNQLGGYVRITSDRPVIAFELFGNYTMDFMVAVPAQ